MCHVLHVCHHPWFDRCNNLEVSITDLNIVQFSSLLLTPSF
jgi:hypothetical protein